MLIKHLTAILVSLILLSFGLLSIQQSNGNAWTEAEETTLATPFVPIESLDFDEQDPDLDYLKEVLKDKQVVLLGEQLHQDGSSFRLKAKMVKFLHEELGFNLLVYEAGLFDSANTWKRIQGSDSCRITDFLGALWPFWVENQDCAPLLDYICEQKNTDSALMIAGMDVQTSGRGNSISRKEEIKSFFERYPVYDSLQTQKLYRVLDSLWWYANPRLAPRWQQERLDSSARAQVRGEIQYLRSILISKDSLTQQENLYAQYLQNYHDYFDYIWKYRRGTPIRFNIRDSLMAENFFWLRKHLYPEEKTIVWLANKHAGTGSDSFEPPLPFKPSGYYLKRAYGEQVYSIGITSHARREGNYNTNLIEKNIEAVLAKKGLQIAFLDMQQLSPDHPLKEPQYMRFDEGANLKAKWPEVFDGVFFIDTIQAIKPLINE